MNCLIIIVLGVSIVACFVTLVWTWVEIHSMIASLKTVQGRTNPKLQLMYSNPLLEQLAEQVNRLLENKMQAEIEYTKKDLQQKQMIANISHDLRTPLTSVIGYIQLLQDENLPREQREQYTEIVLGRAKSLQTLISDFFDLSRCEAGEFTLDLKPVRLQDVLCELIAVFYADFTAQGIAPVISIDHAVPGVIADEGAVKRIYQNIIHNMLRHGSGRAEITLGISSNTVVTSFTNHASELTQDDVQHLFERFFTADRTRSRRNTGLGLAIAKVLVERMEGVITASIFNDKLTIAVSWRNTCN